MKKKPFFTLLSALVVLGLLVLYTITSNNKTLAPHINLTSEVCLNFFDVAKRKHFSLPAVGFNSASITIESEKFKWDINVFSRDKVVKQRLLDVQTIAQWVHDEQFKLKVEQIPTELHSFGKDGKDGKAILEQMFSEYSKTVLKVLNFSYLVFNGLSPKGNPLISGYQVVSNGDYFFKFQYPQTTIKYHFDKDKTLLEDEFIYKGQVILKSKYESYNRDGMIYITRIVTSSPQKRITSTANFVYGELQGHSVPIEIKYQSELGDSKSVNVDTYRIVKISNAN